MGGLVQDQPTRLRLPTPGYKDPYTGAGQNVPQYPNPQRPDKSGPLVPSQPAPTLPQNVPVGTSIPQPPKPPTPKLEVSPFMTTIYQSIQNIEPEQRGEYLSTTASSIKDRMDRFEFRIARGIPLSPEMQRQYESLRGAYNDIQKYISNPTPYDELFGQWTSNITKGQQLANPNRGEEIQRAMGTRFAGG
jgi:hypothetical protein